MTMMVDDIQLDDGSATLMGSGVFVVFQTDEEGVIHSVVLTEADLRRMLGE